jgi:hypothetical protein
MASRVSLLGKGSAMIVAAAVFFLMPDKVLAQYIPPPYGGNFGQYGGNYGQYGGNYGQYGGQFGQGGGQFGQGGGQFGQGGGQFGQQVGRSRFFLNTSVTGTGILNRPLTMWTNFNANNSQQNQNAGGYGGYGGFPGGGGLGAFGAMQQQGDTMNPQGVQLSQFGLGLYGLPNTGQNGFQRPQNPYGGFPGYGGYPGYGMPGPFGPGVPFGPGPFGPFGPRPFGF